MKKAVENIAEEEIRKDKRRKIRNFIIDAIVVILLLGFVAWIFLSKFQNTILISNLKPNLYKVFTFDFYMAEQVLTGGVKSFSYNKQVELRLDDERKKDIKEAYNKYYERKDKEKRNKKRNWIILIIAILIILVLAGIWVLRQIIL